MNISTKKFPIIAGMEYKNGKIINAKMRKIGYIVVQFTCTEDGQLIDEKQIKRVIYK